MSRHSTAPHCTGGMRPRSGPPANDLAEASTLERALAEAGRRYRAGEAQAGRELLEQTNAASLAALAETLLVAAGSLALIQGSLPDLHDSLTITNRRLAAIAGELAGMRAALAPIAELFREATQE